MNSNRLYWLPMKDPIYAVTATATATATATGAWANFPLLPDLHCQRYIPQTKITMNRTETTRNRITIYFCMSKVTLLTTTFTFPVTPN